MVETNSGSSVAIRDGNQTRSRAVHVRMSATITPRPAARNHQAETRPDRKIRITPATINPANVAPIEILLRFGSGLAPSGDGDRLYHAFMRICLPLPE